MWSVVPTMNDNVSSIETNFTCSNGTCVLPLQVSRVKWGLLALIVVILCTAVGNLLVCLAVCWERRLQNMTNYFLMSLAIADFLVSIIVMPFGMVVEIYGYFPLGAEFCAFWVTMDVLMCTASIWHMCTMSMDRYFTLKYPMQYGRNKTKTMVAVKIVFVWAISLTISSPISIYGLTNEATVFNEQLCLITLKDFVIYGSIFAFYVPLCIMILTYTLTIRILWQNQHMMKTIDRTNFRMRPRNNKTQNKSSLGTAMLSPPSSDSRRESHTDISSLARTPNVEKVNLPTCSESDLKFLELKNALDKTYEASITAPITGEVQSDNDESDYENTELQNNINHVDGEMNNNAECTETLSVERNPMLNVPITMIQSPSSEDEDEHSALLSSSTEKLSRSFSHSSGGSRFRLRTNTNVSSKSYLNTHSSLKIPKVYEKNNLQASVSCSNFTDSKSKEKALLDTLGFQGNGLNRDYRSLEWCHHFHEIQEEMDECLRESQQEQKKQNMEEAKRKLTSQPLPDLYRKHSTETHDSGIGKGKRTDELKQEHRAEMSESADSMDEGDTSSENSSDILSIKLNPKSVYMYKVNDVKGKPFSNLKTTVNENSALNNGAIHKKQSYVKESSYDSDKSSENNHHLNKLIRKPSSIKRFIYKCKKRHGIKNLVSSKTTSNERKASKVLGIIFAVFVILWTPFFIANILAASCDSCVKYITPEMMSSFVWMGYIASLANPIIYTMFNTAFRTAFIKILTCKLCGQGRSTYHRSSIPSHPASMFHDRRQTLTVLINGHQDRVIHSDFSSNGRS